MLHALVIGADGSKADAAIAALWDAGFRSIFRVDDVGEALVLLSDTHPGLTLLLPDVALGASATALAQVSELVDAPVIVAGADVRQSLRCLGPLPASNDIPLAA
ncbi:hypothetical protein [Sphingomonas mali]|uniref:hypothetical protein n=1 Tax=Sphingomonas mali TaxID=40682 RepID=UPI0008357AE1|nr:hypothetical protein [Sphingomonas mali]